MNDLVSQKLYELVILYGTSLIDDPKRCEGLLRDLCGSSKLEINVLILGLKEKVPADLLASNLDTPFEVLYTRLEKRLRDSYGLAEEVSGWVVQSWAIAVGKQKDMNVPEPVVERKNAMENVTSGSKKAEMDNLKPDTSKGKRKLTSNEISTVVLEVLTKYQQVNFYVKGYIPTNRLKNVTKWCNIYDTTEILGILCGGFWNDNTSMVFSPKGLYIEVLFSPRVNPFDHLIQWDYFMEERIDFDKINKNEIAIGEYRFDIRNTNVNPEKLLECLKDIQWELKHQLH